MVFKASKKRERKAPEPIAKGSVMNPSAPIRIWYQGRMYDVIEAMVEDYKTQIKKVLENDNVKEVFATDAAANSVFQKVLERLSRKWTDIFSGFANSTSKEFVDKSEEYSKISSVFSMNTLGIEQPKISYQKNIQNTLGAAVDYNHTLITNIQSDVHEKIYSAVMLSLTSPDPKQQGQSGIEAALKEIGGFAKGRAKLIAEDQTSKLYSALADERLAENGVEEFEWMHSSAGKTPRQTHLARDGIIYKLDDPRFWEGPKSDQGPPGWAIHCRCKRRPVIR